MRICVLTITCFCLTAAFNVGALAQAPTPQHPALPPAAVASTPITPPTTDPIATQLKKTVVFLETDCLKTDASGIPRIEGHLGTAFLIQHADTRFPNVGFNYLVTNRHVATPGIEEDAPCNVVDYKVRANLKNPDPNGVQSEISSLGARVPWVFPSDPSIDLAVLPFGLDQAKYSFLTIPTSLFMTTAQVKENGIVEGDSVLFSGLFVQFLGQVKLEPIVREGKIAMIPDEPVPTTLRSLGKVYLVDAHVFGGNSGSPMLVDLAGERNGNMIIGSNYHLFGIISGYMRETSDFQLQAVASYAGTVVANSGIAMVVPAQQILDILNGDYLSGQRRAVATNFPIPQTPPK